MKDNPIVADAMASLSFNARSTHAGLGAAQRHLSQNDKVLADQASAGLLLDEWVCPEIVPWLARDRHELLRDFIDDSKNFNLAVDANSSTPSLAIYGPLGKDNIDAVGYVASTIDRQLYVLRLESLTTGCKNKLVAEIRSVFRSVAPRGLVVVVDHMEEIVGPDYLTGTVVHGIKKIRNDVRVMAATNRPTLINSESWREFRDVLHIAFRPPDITIARVNL